LKIRVFISSTQKELADERLVLQILLTTDPFLAEHCVPFLYEYWPGKLEPSPQQYLDELAACHVYIGVLWREYGDNADDLSATHHEYRYAQNKSMPTLIAIKGPNSLDRDPEMRDFVSEIKADGHKYDRFTTTEQLQQKVRARLIRYVEENYHIEPTAEQEETAKETIKVASAFERQRLEYVMWDDIDQTIVRTLVAKAVDREPESLTDEEILSALWMRGYFWRNVDGRYAATAAGILLFANDPTGAFPHARVQLAVYLGAEEARLPDIHLTIRAPLPRAIDEAVSFVKKNTRHPLRVVGLNRVSIDEYPEEAVREALVNALAHRDYEDASQKVFLNVFPDRIEVRSPGRLPSGITITKLRAGKAGTRSRNPHTAQGLALLNRMEERGTGIIRMRNEMLNHGLEAPRINVEYDNVIVTLPGPSDNLDRIRTPSDARGPVTPAVESTLNDRQKQIILQSYEAGRVTSGWCCKTFQVSRDTAVVDLNGLVDRGILQKKGRGRGVHYVSAQ